MRRVDRYSKARKPSISPFSQLLILITTGVMFWTLSSTGWRRDGSLFNVGISIPTATWELSSDRTWHWTLSKRLTFAMCGSMKEPLPSGARRSRCFVSLPEQLVHVFSKCQASHLADDHTSYDHTSLDIQGPANL